jgi:uncharacterized protein (TIGR03437 family)
VCKFIPPGKGSWAEIRAFLRRDTRPGDSRPGSKARTLVTLAGTDGTVYQRVYNVNQVQTSRFIDQWPAFDDSNIYGLDPAIQYWLDSIPRPTNVAHLTSIPAGVKLGSDTTISPAAANVSLEPGAGPAFDFFNQLLEATVGFTQNGQDQPIGDGTPIQISQPIVGGVQREGIFENPPGPGAQTFIDYAVPVPNAPSVVFSFSVGIVDNSPRTAPVIFSVAIDGNVAWTLSANKGSWQDGSVNLTQWAGQTIHLRLLTDGGPTGGDYGWAFWSDLELDSLTPLSTSVAMEVPSGITVTGLSRSGTLQTSGTSVSIADVAVPGAFIAFLQPAAILTDGQSQIGLSYTQYTAEVGQIPLAAEWGTSVGTASSAGVSEAGVLITNPANDGRSILAWTVQLPSDNPTQLSFSVGLEDGQPANSTGPGVIFSVLVNGTPIWSQATVNFGWIAGTINLSAFRGQSVLIELVSDCGTTGWYVTALWAGLTFTTIPNSASNGPPQLDAVVDAASYQSGTVSPGEIVALFGTGMGPAQLAGGMLTSENQFSAAVAGVTVLFDGIPAPLIYVSAGQIAAVVPYEMGGAATQVEVEYQGNTSVALAVPVAASTPGIFSADASGAGQAAALNQDYSLNSQSKPAAAGSTIVLFATGAGFSNPSEIDGSLAASPFPTPLLPVSLTIGGVAAEVEYAGAAPGEIAGLLQINAKIPAALSVGPQPVVLTVGAISSQSNLTISVQ